MQGRLPSGAAQLQPHPAPAAPAARALPFPRTRRRYDAHRIAATGQHTGISPVEPVPAPLLKQLAQTNQQLVDAALSEPLSEPGLDAQIVLLGVTHYAPLQQQAVQAVLERVQPQAVALVMPQSLLGHAEIMLPYPQALQLIVDLDSSGLRTNEPLTAAQLALVNELKDPDLKPKLKLGRDILDPYEVIGCYPALDYALRPEQVASGVEMFGWLPGQECAAAVQGAVDTGAELVLVDASPRMQEAWVSGLLREWELREEDLSRQLGVELNTLQSVVPAQHAAWDTRLAQQLAAEAAASDGPKPSKQVAARMVTAFKISRATAMALLPPGQTTVKALEQQAKLQPLKFALFDRQALYIATQLKELCRSRATVTTVKRKVVVSAEAFAESSAASQQPKQDQPPASDTNAHQGSNSDTSHQPFTVVAVVGRQYVDTIRRLWNDPTSALWRVDVPRSFAPSRWAGLTGSCKGPVDPDVTEGGSRPVGQTPMNAPLT